MRRLVLVLAIAVACGRRADPTEAAAARAIRARGPVPVSTSPDGSRALVETPGERGVHLDVVDRPTGAVLAGRDDDDPPVAPAWRPDGGAIAYFRARGHRRAYDLRIWDLAGGDHSLGLPATATAFARYAPDGARIAYLASDARRQRVLTVADVAGGRPRALVGVADRAEAEWSPDGRRLATATAPHPGALTVIDPGSGDAAAFPVVAGELRDLAWSADGKVVAVTGRRDGDAYLRMFLVRIEDGAVTALAPEPGEVHAPRFVGGALAYHVERDGERRIHLAGGAGRRAIGRGDASARLVGVERGTAIVVYRPRTAPAYLAAVPLAPGAPEAPPPPAPRGAAATRIDIVAPDGVRLPGYLWRVPGATFAAVIVHGGPALAASPAYNEKIQLLVDAGFDVVKVDYRGSTGHGAAFEALDAAAPLPGRIADVLAARDHLVRALGLPRGHVVLVGESYGGGLVAAAAASEDVASPAVLISTQPLPARPARRVRCPVVAWHGADDDISPPAAARAHLERVFGGAAQWRLVPGEGHNFAHTDSWAQVYAAVLELRGRACH